MRGRSGGTMRQSIEVPIDAGVGALGTRPSARFIAEALDPLDPGMPLAAAQTNATAFARPPRVYSGAPARPEPRSPRIRAWLGIAKYALTAAGALAALVATAGLPLPTWKMSAGLEPSSRPPIDIAAIPKPREVLRPPGIRQTARAAMLPGVHEIVEMAGRSMAALDVPPASTIMAGQASDGGAIRIASIPAPVEVMRPAPGSRTVSDQGRTVVQVPVPVEVAMPPAVGPAGRVLTAVHSPPRVAGPGKAAADGSIVVTTGGLTLSAFHGEAPISAPVVGSSQASHSPLSRYAQRYPGGSGQTPPSSSGQSAPTAQSGQRGGDGSQGSQGTNGRGGADGRATAKPGNVKDHFGNRGEITPL